MPEDTIIYCGAAESVGEFKTIADWLKEFQVNDPLLSFRGYSYDNHGEYDCPWYTAKIEISNISIHDIVESVESNMYEDWDDHILYACKNDPVVMDGINRINDIFASHPTYYEDQRIIFGEEQ